MQAVLSLSKRRRKMFQKIDKLTVKERKTGVMPPVWNQAEAVTVYRP